MEAFGAKQDLSDPLSGADHVRDVLSSYNVRHDRRSRRQPGLGGAGGSQES